MNRIKEVLEQKGIKQTWLTEKLGKSYNMVNAYAQNRQQPRLEIFMKIAEILDIDVKDLIISKKINTKENWKLAKEIVPGNLGSSIGKSLYEREASMNNFEEQVIMDIGTSANVEFWHRNLESGKGFYINGFKANHYPDFILQTKSGKTILIETKGGHLDNTDSAAKCRLGNEWGKQAGNDFAYFMIFEKKEVDGAYTLDKAKELISGM